MTADNQCPYVVIGSQAGLRSQCRKACRFDSDYGHQLSGISRQFNMRMWWKWLDMYALEAYAERRGGSSPFIRTKVIVLMFVASRATCAE